MLIFLLTFIDNEEDRQKLAAIFNEYHVQMEKVAMRILAEQKDAEDAVQNAFIQVIKHFEKAKEIHCEEMLFWLISIVKNEALMILRKNKKAVPLEDWEAPISDSEPEKELDYKALVELFTQMPDTYRAVLEMKFLLDYKDSEIARRLGISETAVSTRVSRGRRLLQDLVREEGFHI